MVNKSFRGKIIACLAAVMVLTLSMGIYFTAKKPVVSAAPVAVGTIDMVNAPASLNKIMSVYNGLYYTRSGGGAKVDSVGYAFNTNTIIIFEATTSLKFSFTIGSTSTTVKSVSPTLYKITDANYNLATISTSAKMTDSNFNGLISGATTIKSYGDLEVAKPNITTSEIITIDAGKYALFTGGSGNSNMRLASIIFDNAINGIVYNANGGSGTMSPTLITSGSALVVANAFTAPSGKQFKEWNTKADGTGATVAVGTSFTSSKTLYAIWEDIPAVIIPITAISANPKSAPTILCGNNIATLVVNYEGTYANGTVDCSVSNISWVGTAPTTAGNFSATGTLTAPYGYSFDASINTSVNFTVNVTVNKIVSIASLTEVDVVKNNTPSLPSTVTVTFEDLTTGSLAVIWDVVDTSTPGLKNVLGTVNGTLANPNTDNIKAQIVVDVLDIGSQTNYSGSWIAGATGTAATIPADKIINSATDTITITASNATIDSDTLVTHLIKINKNAEAITIVIPQGVNGGTIKVKACGYSTSKKGTCSVVKESGEADSVVKSKSITSIGPDEVATSDALIADITSEGTYYISAKGSTDNLYIYSIEVNVSGTQYLEIREFHVLYNANGGSGTMVDDTTYPSGANATVKANTFTAPTGKQFAGYNTKADGSGTSYIAGASVSFTSDTTLYAQWNTIITNINAPADITKLQANISSSSDFNLPTTVKGVVNEGTIDLAVSWSDNSNPVLPNPITFGQYIYTGTVQTTAPAGYVYDSNCPSTTTIKIIVLEHGVQLVSYTAFSDISVDALETTLPSTLPTQVTFQTDSSSAPTLVCDVTWNGNYNLNVAGSYILTAQYSFDIDIYELASSFDGVVTQKIIVKSYDIESVETISSKTILASSSAINLGLPAIVEVKYNDDKIAYQNVTWDTQTKITDYSVKGVYTLVGTIATNALITNGNNLTASCTITITKNDITGVETFEQIEILCGQNETNLNLPSTVTVNYNDISGAAQTANLDVTWDNATKITNYNIEGDYNLVGTISLPISFENTTSKIATVAVSVKKYEISAIEAIGTKTILCGQTATDIGLPATVVVTYDTDKTYNLPVTWDTATKILDYSTKGEYDLVGTLDFTSMIGLKNREADPFVANVHVVITKRNITDVTQLQNKTILCGQSEADLQLPTQIEVSYDGGTANLNVTWDASTKITDYTVEASYNLVGTIALTTAYENTSNLNATLNVTIMKRDITNVISLSNKTILCGKTEADLELPAQIEVSYDGGTANLNVTWDASTKITDYSIEGVYDLVGVITLPISFKNTTNKTASLHVSVIKYEISNVEVFNDIVAVVGTDKLPTIPLVANVTYNVNDTVKLNIVWNKTIALTDFDVAKTINLVGTLQLPPYLKQPATELKASQKINVIVYSPASVARSTNFINSGVSVIAGASKDYRGYSLKGLTGSISDNNGLVIENGSLSFTLLRDATINICLTGTASLTKDANSENIGASTKSVVTKNLSSGTYTISSASTTIEYILIDDESSEIFVSETATILPSVVTNKTVEGIDYTFYGWTTAEGTEIYAVGNTAEANKVYYAIYATASLSNGASIKVAGVKAIKFSSAVYALNADKYLSNLIANNKFTFSGALTNTSNESVVKSTPNYKVSADKMVGNLIIEITAENVETLYSSTFTVACNSTQIATKTVTTSASYIATTITSNATPDGNGGFTITDSNGNVYAFSSNDRASIATYLTIE